MGATLMDVKAAAKRLTLSKSTLDKMRVRGDGPPFIKVGGRSVRYLASDVDQWIADSRRSSTSAGANDNDRNN